MKRNISSLSLPLDGHHMWQSNQLGPRCELPVPEFPADSLAANGSEFLYCPHWGFHHPVLSTPVAWFFCFCNINLNIKRPNCQISHAVPTFTEVHLSMIWPSIYSKAYMEWVTDITDGCMAFRPRFPTRRLPWMRYWRWTPGRGGSEVARTCFSGWPVISPNDTRWYKIKIYNYVKIILINY